MSWPRACTGSSRKACEDHHDWASFLPTGPSPAQLAVLRWLRWALCPSLPTAGCRGYPWGGKGTWHHK